MSHARPGSRTKYGCFRKGDGHEPGTTRQLKETEVIDWGERLANLSNPLPYGKPFVLDDPPALPFLLFPPTPL